MAEEIRILLADDHPVVRKGLRLSLDEDSGLTVVAEAGDGEAALAAVKELQPDVAVLDIDMPKLDGFAVAREMKRQGSRTKAIFLTLHTDEDLFRSAMELGIQGYILKDSAMQEIVAGVRAVASGHPYLSSVITARLLQPATVIHSPQKSSPIHLTATETSILQLIADGKSSKEIGIELAMHYRTIENHRTNMCRKLGIEGANALLRYALQNKAAGRT